MSKGLSKLQQVIVSLLSGKERGLCYANATVLTTSELLAELEERELLNRNTARKIRLFTVRRACTSLLNRGLVQGNYVFTDVSARELSWSIAAT